jgi:hypothetical protein
MPGIWQIGKRNSYLLFGLFTIQILMAVTIHYKTQWARSKTFFTWPTAQQLSAKGSIILPSGALHKSDFLRFLFFHYRKMDSS